MIDPDTKASDVLQPYIDRLRDLGVRDRFYLTISIYSFSGHFDFEGVNEEFFVRDTWGDVETAAAAHMARVAQWERESSSQRDDMLAVMS